MRELEKFYVLGAEIANFQRGVEFTLLLVLSLASPIYSPLDHFGSFARWVLQGADAAMHFHLNIDSIEERTGNPRPVFLDCFRLALAIRSISARARVHCGYQGYIRGVGSSSVRAYDRDVSILKRLSEGFQCVPIEFW